MPTLTQLQYIVAVDEHRHFGRAAVACHISQPTLSMQIQKVEEEFDFVIFDRLKKPVLATDRGKKFIEQARVLLRENHRLMDLAKNKGSELAGEFRLGVIPTLAPYVVPRFLGEFTKRYPKVLLILEEMKTSTILENLQSDRLDAGIMATPFGNIPFKEEPLFFEPMQLYLSKGHGLLRKNAISLEDLDGRELWLLQEGHCFRNQVVQVCSLPEDGNFSRNIRFEAGSLETLRSVVKNGSGYTLIPELLTETLSASERKDHVRDFRNPQPTRQVSLIYRRDHWKTDVIFALKNVLLKRIPASMQLLRKKEHQVLDAC